MATLRALTQLPGADAPAGPLAPRGDDDGGASGVFGDTHLVGLLAFLATVSMLFIGFTSAYVLRRASADFEPLPMPPLLWLSTALLLFSSAAVEVAHRRLRGWDLRGARGAFALAGALAAAFVLAQWGVFRASQAAGVFLSTNPHSSFFYVLTGLHALHVLGGLGWCARLSLALGRGRLARGSDGLRLFALYWHFLGGLWVYLLALLFWY